MLFIIGVALEGSTPGEKSSGKAVMSYYTDHKNAGLTGVFLTPLLVLLLLLFFSHLRALARGLDGQGGAAPTLMISGAVLWAGGALLGSSLALALVSSSDHGQSQVAQTLNVLSAADWVPFIGGIAVTLIGAGMTVLSTAVLPRWLGWVALVVGVISLAGPGGFLGFFVAPLWMLVAGVLLSRAQPAASAAAV
ncbi:MAG: hypothetical protein QOJ92_762 [Frankiales bacterium]|nr:hypothetical protein [Frankiales bacterium]MDX6273552.1 hypothetical protein [Frankiales bacterium]